MTVITLSATPDKSQEISVGDKAPWTEVTDVNGKEVSIEGEKVYLSFMRFAGCPICNFRMHELIQHRADFEKAGIKPIIIYESETSTMQSYADDSSIPYTLISDPERKLYKLYGLKKSLGKMFRTMMKKEAKAAMAKGNALFGSTHYKRDGSLTTMPADFLIDESGEIRMVHYGSYIGDHPDLDTLFSQ